MNIVLCGMMGCGKSTVGKCLAAVTSKTFLDTDELIVEKYGRIADIFRDKGEAYFRDLESGIVQEVAKKEGLVLSTGGGLVLRADNVACLKKSGKLVYLRTTIDSLLARLKKDGERPLLEGDEDLRERLEGLLSARIPVYEGAADFVVDTDGKTPEKIAKEIVELVGE